MFVMECSIALCSGPQQPAAADDASRRAALRASLAAEQSSLPAQGLADRDGNAIGSSVLMRVDRAVALDSHTAEQQRQVPLQPVNCQH
jgi:hypothetical protein